MPVISVQRFLVPYPECFLDTGISVNAGSLGQAALAIATDHDNEGDSTYAGACLLRFGYSGNHLQVGEIIALRANPASFGVSGNGTLTISGTHPFVTIIFAK